MKQLACPSQKIHNIYGLKYNPITECGALVSITGSQIVGRAPWRATDDCMRVIFILNEIWVQGKVHISIDTLLS
jgi:hypothetical protein